MDRRRLLAATSILLLPLLLWGLSRITSEGGGGAPPPSVTRPEVHAVAAPPVDLPQDVAALLREERYWRAARLLRERVRADSDPELVVVAAKAEAGWGGWSNARALLEGKPWLDRAAGGDGWYVLGRAREEAGAWAAAADAYARYLRAAPDTGRDGERAVGELRLGLALLRAGRVDEGARTLEGLKRSAPSVAGWASILAAEAVAPGGDTARVRALAAAAGDRLDLL
ncbi:MAG TPA: tetratricopeptide repeat protein, partial [Longimicrobium sp.]|nr:tetratricopeptide repeat protein [Longimicrobium sp.]